MAGYSEALFWTLSPRQIDVHLRAYRERCRREHNERMTAAWYAGAIPVMKNPPALKDLLNTGPAAHKVQPWQQIKAALLFAMPPRPKR